MSSGERGAVAAPMQREIPVRDYCPSAMRSGAYSHPAVQQALRNHYFDSFGVPDSMSLPKPNPVELPWYEAVCQVVWRSGVAKHPLSRSWHRAAPRDYPGLLCEAELTKPDIIETAASVQVFGRRQWRALHVLGRPASEKRQGTKSRGVGTVGAAGSMGIWPRASGWTRL